MFVLIVGSEPSMHAELDRALADLGVDWQTTHAEDAVTALAIALECTIDVAVVELRSVGFDGPTLLGQIRRYHPQAARILLLDQAEEREAMRALDCAHRFLNKPLQADQLVEAVESVAELRELLDSQELKEIIGRVGTLPPPPRLYLQLTRALDNPDTLPNAIVNLISQDPAVAAKVLRLCNSAFFSGGRAVTDIRTAVIRLGQQTLRRLVLACEIFSPSTGVANIDREAMQQRALQSSQLAARLLGGSSAELAATAALLADIGMLLPGVRIPGVAMADTGEPSSGPHYAEAGAYLLGLWGVPMPIVEAVAGHHQPGRSRRRGFWVGGAVHVAHALVAGEEVDEKYLESVGLLHRLPGWRKLAEDLSVAA